jgi:hypothetical protein
MSPCPCSGILCAMCPAEQSLYFTNTLLEFPPIGPEGSSRDVHDIVCLEAKLVVLNGRDPIQLILVLLPDIRE